MIPLAYLVIAYIVKPLGAGACSLVRGPPCEGSACMCSYLHRVLNARPRVCRAWRPVSRERRVLVVAWGSSSVSPQLMTGWVSIGLYCLWRAFLSWGWAAHQRAPVIHCFGLCFR
uniref:U73-Liphistoxin-Lth1c_1 n=1 Tax=Liphistius thaleban TaxID=1905330 RepID=A0A4Q8K146_9ARAC